MICSYCNAEIPDNALHCPNCGAPMDSVTQQLADLQRLQTRALETTDEKAASIKPLKPLKPIQHTHEVATRSHRILMTVAVVLFICIVLVLLLSLF